MPVTCEACGAPVERNPNTAALVLRYLVVCAYKCKTCKHQFLVPHLKEE